MSLLIFISLFTIYKCINYSIPLNFSFNYTTKKNYHLIDKSNKHVISIFLNQAAKHSTTLLQCMANMHVYKSVKTRISNGMQGGQHVIGYGIG